MECVGWDEAAVELGQKVSSVKVLCAPSQHARGSVLVRHESGDGVTRASLDAEVARRAENARPLRERDEEARRQQLARDTAMLPGVAVPTRVETWDREGLVSVRVEEDDDAGSDPVGADEVEAGPDDPGDADGGGVVVPEPAEQVVEEARVVCGIDPADVRAHEVLVRHEYPNSPEEALVVDNTPRFANFLAAITAEQEAEASCALDGETHVVGETAGRTLPRSRAIADTVRNTECACPDPEAAFPGGVCCMHCALPSRVLQAQLHAETDARTAADTATAVGALLEEERHRARRQWRQVSIASALGRLEGMIMACAVIDGGECSVSAKMQDACSELAQLLEDHGVLPPASTC